MRKITSDDFLSGEISRAGKKSIAGIALQFLQGFIVLISTVVLARLLGPDDFGVVAALAPVVALVNLLRNFGLSLAVIQSEKLSENEVSGYFWIQVVFTLFLALALASLGPLWAKILSDERMVPLALGMAVVSLIGGLGGIHGALLHRNLLFGRSTVSELTGVLVGLVSAIIAFSLGLGFWSLVVQQIAASLATTSLFWYFCSWRPRVVKIQKEMLEGVLFGGALTIGQLFQYVRGNADVLLVRMFYGTEMLGYYSRAYRIVLLPTQHILGPVMRVALPLLSRKASSKEYSSIFENIFLFCIVVAVPAGVFTRFFPEDVTSLLLGPKWGGAVPCVRALGLLSILIPIGNCLSTNLIVFKKTKLIFVVSLVALLFALVAFAIGIRYSVPVMAEMYAWTIGVLIIIYVWIVASISPVKLGRLLKICLSAALPLSISTCVGLFFRTQSETENPFLNSLSVLVVFASVYAVLVLVSGGIRGRLKELRAMFTSQKV